MHLPNLLVSHVSHVLCLSTTPNPSLISQTSSPPYPPINTNQPSSGECSVRTLSSLSSTTRTSTLRNISLSLLLALARKNSVVWPLSWNFTRMESTGTRIHRPLSKWGLKGSRNSHTRLAHSVLRWLRWRGKVGPVKWLRGRRYANWQRNKDFPWRSFYFMTLSNHLEQSGSICTSPCVCFMSWGGKTGSTLAGMKLSSNLRVFRWPLNIFEPWQYMNWILWIFIALAKFNNYDLHVFCISNYFCACVI